MFRFRRVECFKTLKFSAKFFFYKIVQKYYRNLIDDIKQIEFLNLCPNLENLTLYGNPICVKPCPEADDNVSSI